MKIVKQEQEAKRKLHSSLSEIIWRGNISLLHLQ